MTKQERVNNRKVGIIGMARSGISAARLILNQGGLPFVSDIQPEDDLVDEIKILREHGIEFETGGHTDRLLNSDYIVLSPGVPSSVV